MNKANNKVEVLLKSIKNLRIKVQIQIFKLNEKFKFIMNHNYKLNVLQSLIIINNSTFVFSLPLQCSTMVFNKTKTSYPLIAKYLSLKPK